MASEDGAVTASESPFLFRVSRYDLGLLIDGVAGMVDREHQEAAPLLRRLQVAYREAKDSQQPGEVVAQPPSEVQASPNVGSSPTDVDEALALMRLAEDAR